MGNPVLTICVGLPASGKSTWAREQVAESGGAIVRVNMDDLRESCFPGVEFSRSREKAVAGMRDAMIQSLLARGLGVISDDTNLNPKTYARVAALAGDSAIVEEQSFKDVPLDVCLLRNRRRDKDRVPEEVIYRMWVTHVQDVFDVTAGVEVHGRLVLQNEELGLSLAVEQLGTYKWDWNLWDEVAGFVGAGSKHSLTGAQAAGISKALELQKL